MTLSLDGTIRTWNQGAEQIVGYSSDEAVGLSGVDLVSPDHRGEFLDVLERARRGDTCLETVLISPSGEPVEVALTILPMKDVSMSVIGLMVVGRELTEHRWLARTLDATVASLAAALGDAREAEARNRQLLSDAAHQLRAPVAAIQACAQALLRTRAAPERDRLLAGLLRDTARAADLIGALLRLARLDAGEALVAEACDVVAACANEADRTWTLAPQLQVVVRADVPPHLCLDAEAFREILANVLDNARRHATERIEINATVDGGQLEVRVRDDGPGLTEGAEDQAFERFVTLDGRGGSGLGLAIARQLARAQGGDVVYQRPAFVLRLPANITPASAE